MDYKEFEEKAALYVGNKEIMATAMDSITWAKMANKTYVEGTISIPGFAVMYLNSDDANIPGYPHYLSWSPAKTFEDAYNKNGTLTGLQALSMLKYGYKAYYDPADGPGYCVFKDSETGTIHVNSECATHTIETAIPVEILLKPEWSIAKCQGQQHNLLQDTEYVNRKRRLAESAAAASERNNAKR